MIYTLALLNVISALVLLAATVGLLARLTIQRRDFIALSILLLLHFTSIMYGNIQIMSGALWELSESRLSLVIITSMILRIGQIIAGLVLIYFNIKAYMAGRRDV